MSRRGGAREEIYEERGYYSPQGGVPLPGGQERIETQRVERVERVRAPPVRARDLEDIDYTRERVDRDRQPAFLRREEGYAVAEQQQPLVLRAREIETFVRPVRRERSPSVERVRTRERVVERERSPSPAPVERVTTRTRMVERERSPSPAPVERVTTRTRMVERDRSPSPDRERVRTRIDVRERSGSLDTNRGGDRYTSTRVLERDTRERYREPSAERVRTTTRVVERERERSPSPLPERETIRTRVVERERRRSPSSESSISVPFEPPIIRAPPIHQEIITHHRHIDHGYDYAPAPTPPPPLPRARPVERERETEIDIHTSKNNTEIDIYRSDRRSPRSNSRSRSRERNRHAYDDDVLIDRERDRLHVSSREITHSHQRSLSARPERRRERIRDDESEADYYSRKTDERAYIGEAYNGATKDWAIVDVPPGTERVKMDGIGGASQEVTWQRYNGVRRSKFLPERDSLAAYEREEVSDRRIGRPAPPKNRYGDMWTEITKDLVVREAIEEMGYDFEETEFFFYVIQYLRYEDVLELVRLTEEIKHSRKRRIRDMAWERERLKQAGVLDPVPIREDRRLMPAGYEQERVYERDVVWEGGRDRRSGGGRYLR